MIGYLRHLAHFGYVVRSGSMTGAARRLGCTASTLSESVKILETHVQEPLLERSKRGVAPTSKGLQIFKEAEAIVDAMEAALFVRTDALEGTVRISAPGELVCGALAPIFATIRREATGIHLSIDLEDAALDHTRYARGIYVRLGRKLSLSDLHVLHPLAAEVVLVGTPDCIGLCDPNDPQAVARLHFLTGATGRSKVDLRCGDGQVLEFQSISAVGAIEGRLTLMQQSVGVVACLRSTIAADLASGALLELLPQGFPFQVNGAVASPHRKRANAVDFVATHLAEAHAKSFEQ